MTLVDKIKIQGPWSIYLFAFLIPLNPKWYGFAIILLVLESLFRFRSIRSDANNTLKVFHYKNPILWLSVFYIFHIVGIWNTTNIDFATMDLGMKSTFIILPVYFFIFNPKIDLMRLLHFLSIGAIISFVVYLSNAFVNYLYTWDTSQFFGSEFSFWMHRGYYSTYLIIAFSYMFYRFLNDKLSLNIYLIGSVLMFSAVLMTQSKTGIILLFLNSIIVSFYFLRNVFGTIKASVIVLFSCFLLALAFVFFIPSNNRFSGMLYFAQNEKLDVHSVESTTARIFMWETASDIISDNFVTGVGTGDVKDELQKLNYQKGYIGVADKNLNAHNQFLNSWVALGLFGFLALLSVFISAILVGKRKSQLLVLLVMVSFFFSFLTESFLEVQAGIIPFAFIVCCIGAVKIDFTSSHVSKELKNFRDSLNLN